MKDPAVGNQLFIYVSFAQHHIRTRVSVKRKLAVAAGQRDPSPAARAFWQRFPRGDGEPTPEDVILRLAEEARRRMNGGTS